MSDERTVGMSAESTYNQAHPAGMTAAGPTIKVTSNGKRVRVRRWSGSIPALSTITQVVLGLVALMQLYVVVADLRVKGLLASNDLDDVLHEADRLQAWTAVNPWLALVGAVLFLVWFHRVWVSDRSDQIAYTRGTGMAVAGWFIPVACFAFAPLALRDLWWGAENAKLGRWGQRHFWTPPLVAAWGVAFAATCIAWFVLTCTFWVLEQARDSDQAMGSLQNLLTLEVIGSAVMAVCLVLQILVMRRIMAFTRR